MRIKCISRYTRVSTKTGKDIKTYDDAPSRTGSGVVLRSAGIRTCHHSLLVLADGLLVNGRQDYEIIEALEILWFKADLLEVASVEVGAIISQRKDTFNALELVLVVLFGIPPLGVLDEPVPLSKVPSHQHGERNTTKCSAGNGLEKLWRLFPKIFS